MKPSLTLFILMTTVYSVSAKVTDSLQIQLARKWVNSKNYSLKLAASMPEKDFDFKPTPEQMSFSEQLLHIADNMNWLSSSYLFMDVPQKRDPKIKLSKDEVLKVLSAAYDRGLSAHSKVQTSQLDEKVKFFAGPMTRRQILTLMHDHQTHHFGQLIVYVRLKGIKPPDYVGW